MIELKKFIGKTCRSWRALFRGIFNFPIWHTFNWHFTFRLWTILLPIVARKCPFMIGRLNLYNMHGEKNTVTYLRIVSIDNPETFQVLCIVFSRRRIQILWPLIVFSTKKSLKIRKKCIKIYVYLDKWKNQI